MSQIVVTAVMLHTYLLTMKIISKLHQLFLKGYVGYACLCSIEAHKWHKTSAYYDCLTIS